MPLRNVLVSFLGSVLDVAFPAICVDCGGDVEGSPFAGVCRGCAPRIIRIVAPRCLTCGFPFFGETESQPSCMHCEHLKPEFGQGWSVALYRGPLRALIHALKYEKGFWALRDLGILLRNTEELADFARGAELVPVPLHPRKLRERGYNQSELIADLAASVLPEARAARLLERVVDTPSQTQFDRQSRIRNLRNAFSLRRNRAIEPAQHYIVVDDVFTTGSTLNACAAALRRAGAKRVDVLAIGHG